ncbi:MAG: sugar ABC transporter permease [Bacillati bacterium ANGP1]|uniref:Sugar ABC transporter permease n=1 Tax=Candidatus Segetimicrobium genomatis TaxID=2569760 RepID=A0A537M8G6_9BACT|nr:MAG: sugar ABC transporter permease [Terrabacteria group bacterium ANGP1]
MFPAPAVILVGLIIVYPVLYTGWMSLQQWFASSLTPPRFIGVAHYREILVADPRFRDAFFRTLYFTLLVVSAETVLGGAMALLFNREFWGRGLVRTLSILPMVATPTAIALVFVMMYHPTLGVMNYLVTRAGLSPFAWTYSSRTALYALALVDVWEWTPLIMLIALAGLAALPKEPYESAVIDGATGLRTFWHITFDIIFVMTQGGPSNATETINLLLFNQAFSYFNIGYASAMAVALFAIVMGASLILMKVRRAEWSSP